MFAAEETALVIEDRLTVCESFSHAVFVRSALFPIPFLVEDFTAQGNVNDSDAQAPPTFRWADAGARSRSARRSTLGRQIAEAQSTSFRWRTTARRHCARAGQ